ncbi:hypothetical protein [Parapedobacter indicus]|uniref:PEGA domain-containing protein n=1 Tax=Parapedobacter indicus TaxID=1477437 RepID=A0A1I3DIB9_9SPHI|nr:hypothetical protein [Parapedobacter indicus]PPL04687.1 hypothetical protein CLV26_101490 [Parapedobacter indicus]SFH86383.1 hypothetical protein SAMN05444682_101477 [Parapedobacter indicus]
MKTRRPVSCIFFLLLAFALFALPTYAQKAKNRTITINTESGASLYVDGSQVTAPAKIKIPKYATVNVKVEKVGFVTEIRDYENNGINVIPKTDFIQLNKDEAYENSFVTNLANQDIDIRPSRNAEESWILLNRIVTGTFDVIAIMDKTTGYMATAWSAKSFNSGVVRTRLIVKTNNTEPLEYKAKLVSEIAPPGTSVNADESFRKWDRVLRTYENVIPDLQSRLSVN